MFNPQEGKLQVYGANMLAVQLWLTKAAKLGFVPIVQNQCTFFAFMPFRWMIVFEVPGQFLTSGKLPIARNAPGGQEGLDLCQL